MSLPEHRRIVIIGGVACGPKAAARAQRLDPSAVITLIERDPYLSYAGCGLPYFVAGAVKKIEGLMETPYGALRDRRFFEASKGIRVLQPWEAISIDRERRLVCLRSTDSREELSLGYDELVIATGSSPVIPPIPGMDLGNVFTLHDPRQAIEITERINAGEMERLTIIGGGRIGLEIADACNAQAVCCTIVEMEDRVLPRTLDPEMAEILHGALRAGGVRILLEERVQRLAGNSEGMVSAVVTQRQEIETDAVLVAAGVRPNVELARAAGLELGITGAIAVDDRLRTSDPHIFAGGDCVEVTHLVTGKKVFAPLGSTANRHGRVIGTNVTGGSDAYPGIAGTSIMLCYGQNVARTGLSEVEAREAGFDPVASYVPAPDRSHFFPGGKSFVVKLVADRGSRKLLGAQIVGPGDVARPIDTVATTLRYGGKLADMADMDLCYAPPYATAMNCLANAANVLANKLDGLAEGASPWELRARLVAGDRFMLLDVRSSKEFDAAHVADERTAHIPIDQLRYRLQEVPDDAEALCMCQVGSRAYEAVRILAAAGRGRVRYVEGGFVLWSMISGER